MKLRILALACAALLAGACSAGTPAGPSADPTMPVPNAPDREDLAAPPRP